MRFGTLGPFVVVNGAGRELALGGLRQRAVLAILVLHAGEVVSIERLIDELWGEGAPPSAVKTVQVYVSHLRKALGDGVLLTRPGGYVLDAGRGEFDLVRFEELAAAGRRALLAGRAGEAAARSREALALWRGPALADFAYEPFAQGEAMRLEELRQATVEDRIEAELELGENASLVGELETVVRGHPLRERPHAQLMLALYRAGRQADALDVFQRFRARLADQLGLEPGPELKSLQARILDHAPTLQVSACAGADRSDDAGPATDTSGPRLTNLPLLTRRLVGRERELDELRTLLLDGSGAVVTLTGIGGIGKTLLAVATGHDLLDRFPGGAFIVRLAGIHDPESILPMIADAVGVAGYGDEPLDSLLVRRLGEQPTIVVLDNFEQLVSGSSIVATLAARAEQLRVLITSQVPLRVSAEQTFPLGPLTEEDAATLFIERARGRGGFSPTDEERPEIDDICARVDRMPLAIELAAARVAVLSPFELARRLERPLGVLTQGNRDAPERQRSLRAAIDWTHALLTADQKSLFARLGVCAGAVPLEFVEALSPHGSAPETLDALDELLACSLVRRHEHEHFGVRFLVPQALRDYALERLVEAGEEPAVRALHAEQVQRVGHAARLWKWGSGAEDRTALLAVGAEIRPAVAWSRRSDPTLHVRICSALCSYWTFAGVLSEIRGELSRALESGVGSSADRAWITTLLAKVAQMSGAPAEARELMAAAIAEWQVVGDEHERALGLGPLIWVVRWDGGHELAIELARESLEILRRAGETRLVLRGLVFLAQALSDSQDYTGAKDVLVEADRLAAGDPTWELAAIHGDCAEIIGDYLGALALFAESLSCSATNGETHQMLMDMRAIVLNLAWSHSHESALEAYELTKLEELRTGRTSTADVWARWIADAVAAAQTNASPEAAAAARARAANVDAAQRALRVIQLAEAAT
jgi:predicted ATPase/DNA-binding SARP family transcriptional activator